MKIAVPYQNGQVFQHFDQAKQFKLYNVNFEEILSSDLIDVPASDGVSWASLFKEHSVNILICGSIMKTSVPPLQEAGIQIFGGAFGSADDLVLSFLEGNLSFTSAESLSQRLPGECDGNLSACQGNCCF